jgi:hypothetical protein
MRLFLAKEMSFSPTIFEGDDDALQIVICKSYQLGGSFYRRCSVRDTVYGGCFLHLCTTECQYSCPYVSQTGYNPCHRCNLVGGNSTSYLWYCREGTSSTSCVIFIVIMDCVIRYKNMMLIGEMKFEELTCDLL